MTHVDSVYSFGKGRARLWVAVRDIVQQDLLKDGELQVKNTGGLRKTGESPNLSELMSMLVEDDLSRAEAYMDKFKLLNQRFFENIEQLEAEIKGPFGFTNHRRCHDSGDVSMCCRGFWDRHKEVRVVPPLGSIRRPDSARCP